MISTIILTLIVLGYFFYNTNLRKNFSVGKYVRAAIPSKTTLLEDKITLLNNSSINNLSDLGKSELFGSTMMFTSYRYGISFKYLTNWIKKTDINKKNPTKTLVSRNYNKICILPDIDMYDEKCSKGQFVEIYSKDSNKTFEETISNNFLQTGVGCSIKIHQDRGYDIIEVVPETSGCIGKYAVVGSHTFFQYSTKIPNKFILVSINQYPIYSDVNYNSWDKTIEIF